MNWVARIIAMLLGAYSLLAFVGASSNLERIFWAVVATGALAFAFLFAKPPWSKR